MTDAPMHDGIKVCDICGRSEVDDLIERGPDGELITIAWNNEYGCHICDDCKQQHPDPDADIPLYAPPSYEWITQP
jgi:hypothetical protein